MWYFFCGKCLVVSTKGCKFVVTENDEIITINYKLNNYD